jgi:oligoribonuclease
MSGDTWLLWIDIESTGPDVETDEIVEIACILTTSKTLVEAGRFHALVKPTPGGFLRLVSDPVVLKMHIDNGLLIELTALSERGETGLEWLDNAILDWLERLPVTINLADDVIHLAGSGVAAFDRPLIRRLLPELDAALHYAPIDVGVLRRTWKMWAGQDITGDNAAKNHRAMSDVEGHLREALEFQHRWKVVRDVLANARQAD